MAKLTGMTMLVALVVALSAAPAHADLFIVQPTGARHSSYEGSMGRTAEKTIIGQGLDASPSTNTDDSVPTTWPGHTNEAGSGDAATMWLSGNTLGKENEWVMYDLGESYELMGMHVWNQNEATGAGINSVDVKFATSLTAAFGSANAADSGWGTAITDVTSFTEAPKTTGYTGEDYSFSQVTARYVLFDANTTHNAEGTRVGLSEVRFTAIPEPGSLGLVGLMGALLLMRRRLFGSRK